MQKHASHSAEIKRTTVASPIPIPPSPARRQLSRKATPVKSVEVQTQQQAVYDSMMLLLKPKKPLSLDEMRLHLTLQIRTLKKYHINQVASKNGHTLLTAAVMQANIPMITMLVNEFQADINQQDEHRLDKRSIIGYTPLTLAACHNLETVASCLLELKADPEIRQIGKGNAPLHSAASTPRGQNEVLRLLLSIQGINASCQRIDGASPLDIAIRELDLEKIKLVIEIQGRSLMTRDSLKWLTVQGRKEKDPEKMQTVRVYCEAIIAANEAVVQAEKKGESVTPHKKTADQQDFFQAIATGNASLVTSMLASLSFDINQYSDSGDTAVLVAARWGQLAILETLLSQGGERYAVNHAGQSALHLSASGGHFSVIEYLCRTISENELNHQDDAGDTPLHLSAKKGDEKGLDILLKKGAKVDIPNEKGVLPLHAAAYSDKPELVSLLVNCGAVPLMNAISQYGTPSLIAIQEKQAGVLQQLLFFGAQLMGEIQGKSYLHFAILHMHIEVFQLVLKRSQIVTGVDAAGETVIMTAVRCRERTALKWLLEDARLKPAIDQPRFDRQTPLHLAVLADDAESARLLLEAKGSTILQNKDKITPMELANKQGAQQCMALFSQKSPQEKKKQHGITEDHITFSTEILSQSAFSTIRRGSYTNTEGRVFSVAIKNIGKGHSEAAIEKLEEGIEFLNKLAFTKQYAVNYHGIGKDKAGNYFIVMDYVPGRSLMEQYHGSALSSRDWTIDQAHRETLLALFIRIAQGIAYVHEQQRVFSGLTASKILSDGFHVWFTAMGEERLRLEKNSKTFVNRQLSWDDRQESTSEVKAVLTPTTSSERLGDLPITAADVWAFGVIMSEIALQHKPSTQDIENNIKGPHKAGSWLQLFWLLVEQCLKQRANERPKMSSIIEQLGAIYQAAKKEKPAQKGLYHVLDASAIAIQSNLPEQLMSL